MNCDLRLVNLRIRLPNHKSKITIHQSKKEHSFPCSFNYSTTNLPNYQISLVPVGPSFSLERLLQVFAGLVESALGVVAGLDGLAVFVYGA